MDAQANWHPKREARKFEPPPWEREQFEALEQRRAEDSPPAEQPEPGPGEARTPPVTEEASAAPEPVSAETPAEEPEQRGRLTGNALPIPEAQVDTMLIQLSAEEPKVDRHLKSVGLFASAIVMLLGVSLLAQGVIAMLKARGTFAGMIGALIVAGFGAFLGGMGLWFGMRVTRQGD